MGFLACIAAILTWYRRRLIKRRKSARKTIAENDLKLNVEIDEDRNGDLEQVATDNATRLSPSTPDTLERDQLMSKLDTMQRDLEEMKSLIRRKDGE